MDSENSDDGFARKKAEELEMGEGYDSEEERDEDIDDDEANH